MLNLFQHLIALLLVVPNVIRHLVQWTLKQVQGDGGQEKTLNQVQGDE